MLATPEEGVRGKSSHRPLTPQPRFFTTPVD